MFDLFAQGKQALDRSRGGLGLGLTVVRQLVELHGGTVEAASAGEGRGSTFTVLLPLAPATARRDDSDDGADGGARCTSLVVEDNDDAREMLVELLTSAATRSRPPPTASTASRSRCARGPTWR